MVTALRHSISEVNDVPATTFESTSAAGFPARSSTPTKNAEKAAGEICKLAGPSVVLIETYGDDGKASRSGSGFLVSADGKILTNFHVIAHTKKAPANEDAYDTVKVIDVDKRKDGKP